ncbi:MAG: peroxidase-related enzyme [Opitutae bacterium]|nr:peroxidase-related enzyme [Opitutae bacterium]
MSHFQGLPADARLLDVFKQYPRLFEPLLEYHQRLLREDSPFTVAERELLAAYVSAVNACRYCAGIHEATARRFGVDEHLLARLLDDPATAPVPDRMRPVFCYVRKLTETPTKLTEADVAAFFAAGWDDRALHDAVAVCALFNCMNRLVEGFGISVTPEYFEVSSARLASDRGYATLTERLCSRPPPTGQ